MPAGDGTGPEGMGSRTGRGAGYCAGFNAPGFMNGLRSRMGMGLGRGGGRGRNRFMPVQPAYMAGQYAAPYTPENEAESLKQNAQMLQNQLDQISKRLDDLKNKSE